MGIYLPKVDMPQGDETLTIQICPDGSIWERFRGTVPGAKAIPIPVHGDLIDRNSLIKELGLGDLPILLNHIIRKAPVIIPEEK